MKQEKQDKNSSNTIEAAKLKVALFADTYINYHETEVGKHVIGLLEKLGCSVLLIDAGCCQRPRISNGFLKEAKSKLEILAEELVIYIDKSMKILVVEPSCTTALIDDLPDLIENEKLAKKIKENVLPIESFILQRINSMEINPLRTKQQSYVLHGHCHQKSTYGTSESIQLLKNCGAKVQEVDSTCCGMAGAFGYEKNHYVMSETLGYMLVDKIKSSGCDNVVANGYSCRHQLHDIARINGKHVVMELE